MLLITFLMGYAVVALSIGRLVTVAKLGDSLNTDITCKLSRHSQEHYGRP